jgi:hypothetical protein
MVTERSCFKISGGKVNVFASLGENGNAIATLHTGGIYSFNLSFTQYSKSLKEN